MHQRLALREGEREGVHPHQLIMTATPIPAPGDDRPMRTSTPRSSTSCRRAHPITTVALPDSRRGDVIERSGLPARRASRPTGSGTPIEESEVLECQAAEDTAAELQNLLPGLHIGLVHGRMRPVEKQRVMESSGRAYCNCWSPPPSSRWGWMPNASLMIIENPERLRAGPAASAARPGRARVRGLPLRAALPRARSPRPAQSRLGVPTGDQRRLPDRPAGSGAARSGELLGTRQTGLADLKIADLVRDQPLIPRCRRWHAS